MRAVRRTSATNLRQRRRQLGRAGFTLVESMVASVLLSVSVVGVSGTILSSYEHDVQSKRQHDAVRSAESLKEELTALPMDPASSSDVGLTDFASYSDTIAGGQASVATASKASTKQAAAAAAGGSSSGSGTTSTGSTSGGGLLGGTLGLVGGVVGGLLGGGSSSGGSSGTTSGTTSGGTSGTTSGGTTTQTTSITTSTQAALATPQSAATRTVKVERVGALNGAITSTGPLAIVTIDAVVGGQTVRLKRLVSTTEAAAYTGSAQ